jgi:hypothetical protein
MPVIIQTEVDYGRIRELRGRAFLVDDNVVKDGGQKVKEGAQMYVPVLTGELHDSIEFEFRGNGEGWVHAWAGHAGFVEVGTRKMAAQPYLVPAVEDVDWIALVAYWLAV